MADDAIRAARGRPLRRVLLVSGGGRWAVWDTLTGLYRALKRRGLEVHPYHLDDHLNDAAAWIEHQRERHGEEPLPKDELIAAAMFQAGEAAVLRALAFNVDAVIVLTGLFLDPRIATLIARARIPVFLYGTESPYDDDVFLKCAPAYAIASTNERTTLPALEECVSVSGGNTRTMHLPLGYDPELHRPGNVPDESVRSHDVVFVGSMFPARARLLEQINWEAEGIDLGLYGFFTTMPADSPLWKYANADPEQPWAIVPNKTCTALHARAKIVINLFRCEAFRESWDNVIEVATGESINPRIIECSAAGNFVVSEHRAELDESPWAGLIPTFQTPGELLALLRHYLQADDARNTLASRLPDAAAGWSYDDRAATIVEALTEVRAAMR